MNPEIVRRRGPIEGPTTETLDEGDVMVLTIPVKARSGFTRKTIPVKVEIRVDAITNNRVTLFINVPPGEV